VALRHLPPNEPGANRFCHGCGAAAPDASPGSTPPRTETPGRLAAEMLAADPSLTGESPARAGRILLVVSRDDVSLYKQLVREFGDKPNISVIVDRRVRDRRTVSAARDGERRAHDRRVRIHTDSQLRALGWSIIRFADE
jgi:hypothetical protein